MKTRALFVLLAAAACGSAIEAPPFRILYPDNRESSIREVLQRTGPPTAAAPTNASGRPIVVAAAEREVIAFDLEHGRRVWHASLPVASRPVVTKKAVIVMSGEDVVALSMADGHTMWRVPVEETFLGADANDDTVFVAFGTAVSAIASITVRRAGALVALRMRDGDERWRIETNRQFGAPQVVRDLVFLPWERQYVSVFDAARGAEIARLRSRDDVIGFVQARPEGVFYGGRGLYRLTARSSAGTKAAQTYRTIAEPIPLPGEPRMGPDAYSPPTLDAGGERIRLFWAAAPAASDDDVGIAGDLVYSLHYKYVFGLGLADGAVRWGSRLPSDVVGAHATSDGLLVAAADGTVLLLGAADGLVHHRSSLGLRNVRAATFDVGSFRPADNVEPTPAEARTRLLEIATDRDNRLAAGRAFATKVLATLPEPEVTADLVQIVARVDLPQVIRDAATQGLAGRRAGTSVIVDALASHYDYVTRTQPSPVGPLAAAAGAAGERRAVPALLAHLDDPHTSPEALAAIAQALGQIGDRAAIEPLLAFMTRYHADDALGRRPPALAEAAKSLLRLGARPVRVRLEALAADPNALPFVRDSIRSALAGPEPEPETPTPTAATAAATPAASGAAHAPAAAQPATPPAHPPAPPQPALPRTLAPQEVQGTLGPQLPALRRCVAPASPQAPAPPGRLRLGFGLVGNTGKAEHLAVTPRQTDAVVACMSQVFEALTFPRFSDPRQRITFTLETAPPAPQQRPTKAPPRGQRPANAPPAANAPAQPAHAPTKAPARAAHPPTKNQ